MTIFLMIIGGLLGLVLLIAFAKSAEREANRITIEANFRLDGLKARLTETRYLLQDDNQKAEVHERKANRLKARAEEVASRQASVWKAYSRATGSHDKG